MPDNNDAQFSRSGSSCSFGKCTDELKTMVPEEVKAQFTALAVINSTTVSEYLRDLCIAHVYGHVATLRAKYGNGTAGKGRD